jgi:hypothetical protein
LNHFPSFFDYSFVPITMAIDNKSEQETISKTAPVETKDGNSVEDAAVNEEPQEQPEKEETKNEEPATESDLKEDTPNDKDEDAVEPCSCESNVPDKSEDVEQDATNSKKRSSPLSKEGNKDNDEPPSQKVKVETEEQ